MSCSLSQRFPELFDLFQNRTSAADIVVQYPDYPDYPDYDDSEGTEFLFVTEGVILTIVSVFGIVGTLMSVGVIVRRDVRSA